MNLAEQQALSPDEFRALQLQRQRKAGQRGRRATDVVPPSSAATAAAAAAIAGGGGGKDGECSAESDAAYKEFCNTCRALSLKANTALLQHVDVIRGGAVVDLSYNFTGAAGLQAMTPLLSRNTQLQTLRLPHNGITNDAVVFLCRALIAEPAGAIRSLAHLDLSDNAAVSLAGGLALLSLVQHTLSVLTKVDLAGTQVPEALLARLSRSLAAKGSSQSTQRTTVSAATVAADSVNRNTTSAAAGVIALPVTRADDRFARISAVWAETEPKLLTALRHRLVAEAAQASVHAAVAPVAADVHNGWRVLEVPVLAPAGVFLGEVRSLLTDVFPRLNAEMRSRRVALVPLIFDGTEKMGKSDDRGGRDRPELRHMHFTMGTDLLAGVRRSRFLTVELVGDRPGSHLLPPTSGVPPVTAAVAADSVTDVPPAPPLHPVMYAAHDAAVASARWLLIAKRMPTRHIPGLPPTIAALLSVEPSLEHPDQQRALVRRVAVDGNTIDAHGIAGASAPSDPARQASTTTATTAVDGKTVFPFPIATRLALAPEVGAELWRRHEVFCAEALAAAPTPELAVVNYPARYDGVAADGTVPLGGLEAFTSAVYERLSLLLTTLFREIPTREESGGFPVHPLVMRAQNDLARRALLNRVATATPAKKSLANRLSVYVTAPASRNTLVVHGSEQATLTTALANSAARLLALPSSVYRVAYHQADVTQVCEEPTDARAVMVNLLTQLTPNPAVLQYAREEVDVTRLRRFFTAFLAGATAGGPTLSAATTTAMSTIPAAAATPSDVPLADCTGLGNSLWTGIPSVTAATLGAAESNTDANSSGSTVLVVILDGLDAIEAPVQPCNALRCAGGTGVDEWPLEAGGGGAGGRNSPEDTSVNICATSMMLIPLCLARNVRVMVSAQSRSEKLLNALRQRGRDSAEVIEAGAASATDVEHTLGPVALAAAGVALSDEAAVLVRAKADVRDAAYQRYLLDALRDHAGEPGTLTQAAFVATLPATTDGMAERTLERLKLALGTATAHTALGLLRCARWGLPALVLRARLKLRPEAWERMVRVLRPVLEPAAAVLDSKVQCMGGDAAALSGSGNALAARVRLAAPSFIALLDRRELSHADTNASTEDRRVFHRALAHHYLGMVHRALLTRGTSTAPASSTEKTAANSIANASNAVEFEAVADALLRLAVKELPYHAAQAGLWGPLDNVVLSVPFLELVYAHGLGYAYLRDLIAAYNLRHQLLVLGEDIGANDNTGGSAPIGVAGEQLPRCLTRMRAYIFFVREHGRRLMAYPSLVVQVALERPIAKSSGSSTGHVQADAQAYVQQQWSLRAAAAATLGEPTRCTRMYFTVTNAGRRTMTHHGAVSAACATRSRAGQNLFITAGVDRTLCWLESTGTGAAMCRNCQPTARIARVATARTGAYVGALAEDRSVYIYDANTAALVSRGDGAEFAAPVASFVFSAGGRYYFVVTEDGVVHTFDAEGGFVHFTLRVADLRAQFMPEDVNGLYAQGDCDAGTTRFGRPSAVRVAPHPIDDERFLTIVEGTVQQWVIAADASRNVSHTVARGARAEATAVRIPELAALSPTTLMAATWLPLSEGSEGSAENGSFHPYLVFQYRTVTVAEAADSGTGLYACDLRSPADTLTALAIPAAAVGSQPTGLQCWTVSGDGAWLAAALTDGRISIYDLRQGPRPSPACVLSGFAAPSSVSIDNGTTAEDSAVSAAEVVPVSGLVLHQELPDSVPSLIALGREREVRYWRLAERIPSIRAADSDGTFVLDAPATCLACPEAVPTDGMDAGTAATKAARVVVGDVRGAVVMLRLSDASAL